MQKTVHIIIYNYLPLFKDGRVNRTQYLIEYLLKEFNYKIRVYTLGLINDKITISDNYVIHQIRSKGIRLMLGSENLQNKKPVPSKLKNLIKQFLILDIFFFQFINIYKCVKSYLKQDDIVYLSVPWFSALLNLLWLKSNQNIVVDYRDALVDNPIFSRNNFQNSLHRYIEKILLRKASEILITTPSARSKFRKDRTNLVRNGVSNRELTLIRKSKKASNKRSKKDFIYFGSIGNKRKAPELFSYFNEVKLDYEIYGAVDQQHKMIIKNKFKGFLDISHLYRKIYDFRSVLVIILPDEDSENAIPGKVYQIIATGVPILLYSDRKSATKKFLESINYVFLFMDCEKNFKNNLDLCNLINSLPTVTNFKNIVKRESEYGKIKIFNEKDRKLL